MLESLCHVNQVTWDEGMPNRPEWFGLRLMYGEGSPAMIRYSLSGFKKVREFKLDEMVTEQTYKVKGLLIDFFGQFYEGSKMIQYSYERISDVTYDSNSEYSVYRVALPIVNKARMAEVEKCQNLCSG